MEAGTAGGLEGEGTDLGKRMREAFLRRRGDGPIGSLPALQAPPAAKLHVDEPRILLTGEAEADARAFLA